MDELDSDESEGDFDGFVDGNSTKLFSRIIIIIIVIKKFIIDEECESERESCGEDSCEEGCVKKRGVCARRRGVWRIGDREREEGCGELETEVVVQLETDGDVGGEQTVESESAREGENSEATVMQLLEEILLRKLDQPEILAAKHQLKFFRNCSLQK